MITKDKVIDFFCIIDEFDKISQNEYPLSAPLYFRKGSLASTAIEARIKGKVCKDTWS